MFLPGKNIYLRSLDHSDASILYKWENDKNVWKVSNTQAPFTKEQIRNFVSSQQDIYTEKQLRLMICIPPGKTLVKKEEGNTGERCGCVDLFDFDPHHLRAGVGILVSDKYKRNGYASEALSILITHCFKKMNLYQLYCNIAEDNKASLNLFKKHKFKITGKKKDWVRTSKNYLDEYTLQLINR